MEQVLNIAIYKDGGNTIVVFKDTNSEVEDIIKKVVSAISNQSIEEKEVEHLEALPEEVDAAPEIPAFMQDDDTKIEEAVDYGSYVITSIKKYEKSGKTIAEIFETDNAWLCWVAENYNPRGAKAKEDVEAIKKFLESRN
jgi:hypothetical protein